MMRRQLSAVAVAVGLTLAGCSSSTPVSEAVPPTSTAPESEHGPGDSHAGIDPGPTQAAPTWDGAAQVAAQQVAGDAMRAFARPGLAPDVWYEELAGHLTAAGQQAFYGTDPALIPAAAVTGEPSAAPLAGTALLARALVPTDAGTYDVLLAREHGEAPWLVERITPPA